MPDPDTRDALDVVRRLEAALVALERSFAALEIDSSPRQSDIAREPSDTSSSARWGEVGSGTPAPRPDQRVMGNLSAALTTEERRRLAKNLEALLEEVGQLADYLASDASAPDPPKPGLKPSRGRGEGA